MELLLGIDIGTTGCKAVLYDLVGNQVSSGYRPYEIISIMDGWAEENPDEWWHKVTLAAQDCVAGATEPDVLGIAVSCANALVMADRCGNACYNAIMQVDKRSLPNVLRMREQIDDRYLLERTGNHISAGGYSPSVMQWMRENMPKIYKNTYQFLSPAGFVVQKLTGKFTMDYSRASTASLMDIREKGWDADICAALEIDRGKLPDLFPAEAVAGPLSKAAAAQLSLPSGIPVSVGLMDSTASVIGAGCGARGKANLVIGTVSRLCLPMEQPLFHGSFLNASLHAGTPYLAMAPTNGGGVSVKWFVNTFGDQEKAMAGAIDMDAYELFDLKAASVSLGSGGLFYLPYLLGERSPMWDPNARGVFFGITPSHSRAHFMRAVMEGVGHATLQNFLLMQQHLHSDFSEIVISGGGARSMVWCEILANMLGTKIVRQESTECETKGAAFVAGLAAGVYRNYKEAEKIVKIQNVVHPDLDATEAYRSYNRIYQSLYGHLKPDFAELAALLQGMQADVQ